MNVYTVHLKGSQDDLATLERAVFVREGFSWAALIFGPLWLLWNRLWLASAVWLALEGALAIWDAYAAPAHSITAALQFLLHLALGFEASQLRRGALARRRFHIVGIVQGRRMMDAERAFFLGAIQARTNAPHESSTVSTRSRPPEMIGLFPSAGA
jgi:signal transduction histidine kinase